MSNAGPYRSAASAAVEVEPCAFCGEPTALRMGSIAVCGLHAKSPEDAQVERAARALVRAAATVVVANEVMERRR